MSFTGPKAYYRPKHPSPITVNLTDEARAILKECQKVTGASRADIFDQLLRRFGQQVSFEGMEPSNG